MTDLVAVVHPLTGKVLRLHPDIAAAQHHWVHPDPAVPTPAASLPLFDMGEVTKLFASLAPAPASEWDGGAASKPVAVPIADHRPTSSETGRVTRLQNHSSTTAPACSEVQRS